VSREVRAAVEKLAKERNLTVADVVKEAVSTYIGLAKRSTADDDLPDVPRESKRFLRDAAGNPDHPLHDVAYGILYAPRSIDVAYR